MRELRPKLTDVLQNHVGKSEVWRAIPYPVATFRRLVETVAELAYANADSLFFFRGQSRDYQSKAGGSTLYPGIYRGDPVSNAELRYRFVQLDSARNALVEYWKNSGLVGLRDVQRKPLIQWSILQHYEVIQTPLLDVTQSLRVACSFAQLGSKEKTCFIYVLGLPQITNRISINSEEELVNVRLLSICPPAALRPHFQEGYLAGTTDLTYEFDTKTELDFRNRMIAKFEIPTSNAFWGKGFNRIPEASLYPRGDAVQRLCIGLKESLRDDNRPGDLGQFVREWSELEDLLVARGRASSSRNISMRDAIAVLARQGVIDPDTEHTLQSVRVFRNEAVHRTGGVADSAIATNLSRLRDIRRRLEGRL